MRPGTLPQTPPAGLDPIDYIARAMETYGAMGEAPYRWATNPDPVALQRLSRPLNLSTLAVISSGGVYRVGQVAFHYQNDTSFRRIPIDTAPDQLRIAHFGYDVRDAQRDPNVILPLAALREMADRGEIGNLCPKALTFMGGIYSQRRVRDELMPALHDELVAMAPDAVLLVPACPICHQTVGTLARYFEEKGVATVTLSSAFSITAIVHPPRSAFLDFPLGHTAGRPHERAEQSAILRSALALLTSQDVSGEICPLGVGWQEDWKVNDPARDYEWPPRYDRPHYQHDEDRKAAIARFGEDVAGGTDPSCQAPSD